MAQVVIVPFSRLSVSARNEVIDEFITRDSCVWNGTLKEKRSQVIQALRDKQAVITYDTKSKTTDIRTIEQLREIDAASGEDTLTDLV